MLAVWRLNSSFRIGIDQGHLLVNIALYNLSFNRLYFLSFLATLEPTRAQMDRPLIRLVHQESMNNIQVHEKSFSLPILSVNIGMHRKSMYG